MIFLKKSASLLYRISNVNILKYKRIKLCPDCRLFSNGKPAKKKRMTHLKSTIKGTTFLYFPSSTQELQSRMDECIQTVSEQN